VKHALDSHKGYMKTTIAYQGTEPLGALPDPGKQALFARYEEITWAEHLAWDRRYRRDKLLGAGGQGAVYLAHRMGADGFTRPVALKVFSPEPYPTQKAYEEDMALVGKACARVAILQSDNVVDIHDFVERDGLRLMEMEWLDGYDLREVLALKMLDRTRKQVDDDRFEYINRVILTEGPTQTRLKPGVAISILRDCLAGLAVLHGDGLVHGDIKPANIMLTRMGSAKMIDIGSAVDLRQSVVRHVWSPAYAAPEVLQGSPSTPRSDLASLGYVLIEMLAGQSPFERTTTYAELVQAKHLLEQRLPAILPPEVTCNELLLNICQRLIATDPARRFPSAQAADVGQDGAAKFHRQLVTSNLASEYFHELRTWLESLPRE